MRSHAVAGPCRPVGIAGSGTSATGSLAAVAPASVVVALAVALVAPASELAAGSLVVVLVLELSVVAGVLDCEPAEVCGAGSLLVDCELPEQAPSTNGNESAMTV